METIYAIVVDSSMVKRFKAIQAALGAKTSEMAMKSGVSDDKIYQFLSGRQNLTLESLRLLKAAYPDINTDYLISGEGNPVRASEGPIKDIEIFVPDGVRISVHKK